MPAGTAIFLAALVFAVLYLYQITRDRWNWRRVVRSSLMAVAAMVAFLSSILAGIFVFDKISNRPKKQTGYTDLRLGMTMAEVKYAKGYPPYVLENPESQKDTGPWMGNTVIATKDFAADQRAENYRSWGYETDAHGTRVDIDFATTTKSVNRIACYSQGNMNCPSLLGVYDGTNEAYIIEQFGKPTHEEIDGVAKKITYANLGIWFYLVKMKVYVLGVTDFDSISKGPPCKDGSLNCKPWERDWSKVELKPGSTVTDEGAVIQPAPAKP